MKAKKLQTSVRFLSLFLIPMVCYVSPINSKVYNARSDSRFNDYLMKRPLAVALFYKEDKTTRKNKALRKKIDQLERLFSTIGKQGYYRNGGVQFIKANIKYDTIKELAESFSIIKLPSFILFKKGVPLKDKKDNPIVLTGWPTYEQLEDFIRDHLEKDIEKNIKRRAEQLRRLREAERWSYLYYRPYFSWGWGGYPYWGYYGRPYWGWGWRGRCCW